MREAEGDRLDCISPSCENHGFHRRAKTERAPCQTGNVSVKHVPPSAR